jgi:hypothetical protein
MLAFGASETANPQGWGCTATAGAATIAPQETQGSGQDRAMKRSMTTAFGDSRFRLAAKIHFALLRLYGVDVGVSTLLLGGAESREALWVCAASPDAELAGMARAFERCSEALESIAGHEPAAAAPQDAEWASNTSGFGFVASSFLEPLEPSAPASAPRRIAATRRLFKPSSWLR